MAKDKCRPLPIYLEDELATMRRSSKEMVRSPLYTNDLVFRAKVDDIRKAIEALAEASKP